MKFEERLTELMNEVDVPDELSPQNIALMLKEKSSQSKMEAEHRYTKTAPSISAQRRSIIMRTAVATAACAVFAVGMWAYNESMASQEQIEAPVEYEAVSPESYDDFYNIYTGITLEQNGTADDNSDRTIDETVTQPVTENDVPFDYIEYNGKNISESDVVKSDENYIYCLKDGILYIISKETMEVVSEIESDVNPPVEIYIEGDKVILVSSETEEVHEFTSDIAENSQNVSDVPADDTATTQAAETNSDGLGEAVSDNKSYTEGSADGESAIPAAMVKKNAVVDIYSVASPENPVHIAAYKQNGSYTSSKIIDGMLYMVSAYSDYRVKPLDTQADLDSFVPAYYFNGEKYHVEAADIIVPSYANSTDYTVVSAINVGSDDINPTVKAVLGSSKNVYCSAETLYIAGVGRKEKEYTIISAFDLSDSGISYRSSGSVEGAVFGRSMNEYDGMFRIATKITDETGVTTISVYVLDKTLTVVNGAGKLLPEGTASAVRFEESYARLIGENNESAMVIDLDSTPPTLVQSLLGSSAYLYEYSENMLLGVGKSEDGGLTLTMYSTENGLAINGIVFGNNDTEINSAALTDRRAVLIDRENGIIGVPAYSHNEFGTQNSYYVFVYDETAGFVQKGVIEYVDVDDSMIFLRGSVSGDTLYIMSIGRVISARLSDMKIIDYYEY
ncbi:MAG: beta-propeller domain-containing protein [Oscillospiraceae bacterium]|nr:beta-propeller domain-containing protein [Oscillospiraceae bacterium]